MVTVGDAAVVLVHGLFSSGDTWNDLKARIAEDEQLAARYDIFTLTYPSPKVRLNPLRSIPDYDLIADDLRGFLDVEVADYDTVVLVSHSQGGLIVQRFLAKMIDDGCGLELVRIRAVVMFACPNSGSQLALLIRRSALFWRHPQEKQLRPLDKSVAEAHSTVVNRIQNAAVLDARNCRIPIRAYAGTTDNVVSPVSAKGMFEYTRALPGDHFTIIKAATAEARSFTALRRNLLTALEPRPHPASSRRSTDSTTPQPVAEEEDELPRPVRHNLPPRISKFFDRDEEFSTAIDKLKSQYPVVSLNGMGGIGKTALANQISWYCADAPSRRETPLFTTIVWAGGNGVAPTVDSLIDSISYVLEYPYLHTLSASEKVKSTIQRVRSERCLIILDNIDDPLDLNIRELIAGIDASRSKVLVTSRYQYTGDTWPIAVGELNTGASMDLITEESSRLGINSVVFGEIDLLADYLSATGGNPMAIRLTVGQMRYGEGLRSMIDQLRGATASQLFTTIFDRIWDDLRPENNQLRNIVMCVALHPKTASRSAIEFVVDLHGEELHRQVREAAETCLIDTHHAMPAQHARLGTQPLTRAYALRRLDAAPATRAAFEDKLVEYYLSFAEANADVYTEPERVALLEAERVNISAFADVAFRRAVTTGDPLRCAQVIRFADAMAGFLWGRGYWHERIRLCENAVAMAESAGDPVALARQFTLIGRVHVWLGEDEAARRCMDRSQTALPADANDTDRRETIRLQAHIASHMGDYTTAQVLLQEILRTAELTADDGGRAATLIDLGVCTLRQGDFGLARHRFEEARQLDHAMGVVEGEAVSLSHLAESWYEAGDNRSAQSLFQQGLVLADRVGRRNTVGKCSLGLAKIAVLEGKYDQARLHARCAREVFERLGISRMTAEADLILANTPDGHDVSPGPDSLSQILRGCRAIMFDFDDTIAATAKTRWRILKQTAADFGVTVTEHALSTAWGLPFDALINELVPTLPAAEFIGTYREAMKLVKPVPTKGMVSLVQRLHRNGIRQVIVGSGSRSLIVQDLEELGVDTYFDSIYGYEQTTAHKPDPRALHPAIAQLNEYGIAADELVYVGDSIRDMVAAWGNRLKFIAVSTGLDTPEDFIRAGLSRNLVALDLSMLRLWT